MAFEGFLERSAAPAPEATPQIETVKGYELESGQFLQQYTQGELVWTRVAKVSGHTITLEDGSSFEAEPEEEFTIQRSA